MARLLRTSLAALLLAAAAATPAQASGVSVVNGQQVLFQGGTGGYGCYRIPTMVRTAAGSLLVFAEARKSASCADRGDIDLVVRRSTNEGRTWGPMRVVTAGAPGNQDSPFTRGNAVPVVDRRSGDVVLVTTSNEATPSGQRLPWVQRSTDDGLTWSAPKAVSASFDGTHDGWFATGPAHGIQLENGAHAGRLVVGAHQKPNDTTVLAGVLYSDDGGENWQASAVPNSFMDGSLSPGEVSVAELPDGTVYANARNEIDGADHRAKATSTDGGTTMTSFTAVPSLVTPNVQGSVLPLKQTYRSTPGDVVVFSGPSDPTDRKQLKIRYSTDRGTTWASAANGLVASDRSGYSDLAELQGGEIGVVYEGGTSFSADEIRFARYTTAQLGIPGTTHGTPSTQPTTSAGPTSPDSTKEANDAYLSANATVNDGLEGYADLPYTRTIDPGAQDFTISTKFRYSTTTTNQALVWGYGLGAGIPQVWVRAQPGSDQITAWVQGKDGGATTSVKDNATRVAFADNQWHQLTLTRTGARIDLTIDGISATASGVVGVVSEGTSGIRLGAKQDGTDAFTGHLKDFQLTRQGVTTVDLKFLSIDGAAKPTRTTTPITEDVSGHCVTGNVLGGIQLGAGRSADSLALQVNATHPGVEAPFSPALDVKDDDFTIAAWFKYSGTAQQAIVWAYGTTSGKRSLWVRAQPAQDRLYAWVQTDTSHVEIPLVDSTTRTAFGDNAWHLLTLTRTGQQVQLGVDGDTASATGLTGEVSADKEDAIKGLRLGSKMDGSDVMSGALDDFRLYHRALSQAEITKAATGRFPSDNPALWWTFNNQNTQAHDIAAPVTGPQTPDSSVHCVHAAVSGSPTVVPGRFGNALNFDGTDDTVRIPYKPSVALGDNDFTIETWLRYTGSADQVLFWAYGVGATERGLWLRVQPGKDRLYAFVQTDTQTTEIPINDTTSATAFGDNTWHHVSLKRQGGTLTLDVDGTRHASAPISGSLTYGDMFDVQGFQLGAEPDGTNKLTGALDEFQIHRKALTADELKTVRDTNADLGPVTAIHLAMDNAA
ncbi:LamG-like jellyroll fold domain-containing protein [Actinocrispum sp. NPDC049592]|uniref:LamG-like jellyroll fold domain-containing protein n=1 Tax=Actinocrispum sp. NPDC049592 TaxID=3154835 RepID=UPI003448B884